MSRNKRLMPALDFRFLALYHTNGPSYRAGFWNLFSRKICYAPLLGPFLSFVSFVKPNGGLCFAVGKFKAHRERSALWVVVLCRKKHCAAFQPNLVWFILPKSTKSRRALRARLSVKSPLRQKINLAHNWELEPLEDDGEAAQPG